MSEIYCQDCDKELSEEKGEYAHGCLDCHGSVQSDKLFWMRKKIMELEVKLDLSEKINSEFKECLEWISKPDTASHVHGPDVSWLTNWRNNRKAAATSALKKAEEIINGKI